MDPKELYSLPTSKMNYIADLIQLWTDLKRGQIQPLFDVAISIPRKNIPFDLYKINLNVIDLPKGWGGKDRQRCNLNIEGNPVVGEYNEILHGIYAFDYNSKDNSSEINPIAMSMFI